ncbi:MAG: hypothetical protein WCI48_02855 [Bacteroidota bacterium]|jgi:hypothetical protein
MKNFLIPIFCLLALESASFGQTTGTTVTHKNQYDVLNDVYVSYGLGSLYLYIDQNSGGSWSYTSPGSFILGYTRSMNKIIGVGFQLAYTPVSGKYNYSSSVSETEYNNYMQALARIKFQYLNKPGFGMYSGIAIGVTMNFYQKTTSGTTLNQQKLLPAGQLTLLGFRVGHGAAFMGEFGIGTLSILNLGFSYKFGN